MPRAFFESLQVKPPTTQSVNEAAKPWVGFREVRLKPMRNGIQVVVQWEIRTQQPGAFRQAFPTEGLSVQQITWDGNAIALEKPTGDNRTKDDEIVGWVSDRSVIQLTGWVSRASLQHQGRRHNSWGRMR